ncbi:MAG: peptidyl-prolyl cis-trans isomerase [Thermodesulfovibrio sp.]|nr:peptidyl-prolyl cis-trans isomerase [Thermodesulfovibrio sp.]
MKINTFFIFVFALILLSGCAKDRDETIVKTGSSKITKSQLIEELQSLPPQTKIFLTSSEGSKRLKEELIKRELLYEEAKDKGLQKSKDFKRRVEEFKKITLINMLLEEELKSFKPVTEKDAKDYYEKHKEEFIKPQEVRLSQIVVKNEEEAKKVYERLNKGEDFAALAKELSRDEKTKAMGGDIGFFKKNQLNPQIQNVVFNLKKGQVSMPLTYKGELYIFKVTDIKGTPTDFESIKNQLIEELKIKKQQEWFNSYIEELKRKHKVEINEKALQEVISQATVGGKLNK